MPTYEYECQKCGYQFEKFQSISDKPLTRCEKPRCKGKVKRLIGTGAGLLFKGSGFYITDYRSSSYKEAAKKESGAASSTTSTTTAPAASGTAKSDSKPATPAKKAASKS